MPDEIDKIRARMAVAAARGYIASASDLKGRAVDDAPIDEGTLRGSAVNEFVVNGSERFPEDASEAALVRVHELALVGDLRSFEVETSFNTPYAAAQHEGHATMNRKDGVIVEWVVKQHPKGGKSKFLESNLIANAERYQRIAEAMVEREVRG